MFQDMLTYYQVTQQVYYINYVLVNLCKLAFSLLESLVSVPRNWHLQVSDCSLSRNPFALKMPCSINQRPGNESDLISLLFQIQNWNCLIEIVVYHF